MNTTATQGRIHGIRRPLAATAALCVALFMAGESATAQDYEITFDSTNASGWFGGDDRTCCGPRNVGNGQSVYIDTSITLNRFAFLLSGGFDFIGNPAGHGHEVTVTLNVRDSSGAILKTVQTTLSDTFNGGWVTWSGIDMEVDANTTLIFTCYLVGAADSHQYTSSISSDQHAGYAGGVRYTKDGANDADMELWTDWSVHSWDASFRLQGTIRIVSAGEDPAVLPRRFALRQNYPNPFNPGTTIRYDMPLQSRVRLEVFTAAGQRVATLVDGTMPAGSHTVEWDGTDGAGRSVASGVYLYRLQSGGFVQSRKIVLIR